MVNINIKEGVDTLSSANAFIPTGSLMMKATAASALTNYDTDAKCISSGFIPCDGRTLNATTFTAYQDLFDIVGNIYGGTNNINFKVPDLRTSRRYIYGQDTVSEGVYTPSLSGNTTNIVTHTHTVNGMSGESLSTNGAAGSHTHSTSYTFSDGGSDYHSHTVGATFGGINTSGPSAVLAVLNGTGTSARSDHIHNTGGVNLYVNTGNGGTAHIHDGSSNSNSYSEPTHTHSIPSSNVSIPASSAIDIPYINMLYFIKI